MAQEKTLVLVDGSALAFRSFYALLNTGMRNKEGTPTWAVYGFFRALFDLLEKRRPDMLAVCFDMKGPTFRHVEYEAYKANRSEMPDDLSAQWPIIKQGVEALGIPIYELEGFEADDIIGTVAKQAGRKDMKVLILTGDQDIFQLLDGYIQVLMPSREGGLATFGRQEVFNKLGIWPEQVIDYKALCGDTSDNIPGVKGIGPKTAVQLLTQYQSLSGIYDALEQMKPSSVKQKLIDGRQSAFDSQSLATIHLDVPLDFDFEHCRVNMPQVEQVAEFLGQLGFKTMLKSLPQILASFNDGQAPEIDKGLLQAAPGKAITQVSPVLAAANGIAAGENSNVSTQLSLFAPSISFAHDLKPEIINTKESLHTLLQDLSSSSTFVLYLETSSDHALSSDIVGYAFAWNKGAVHTTAGHLEFVDSSSTTKVAYVPVRHLIGEQLPAAEVGAALRSVLESKAGGKIAFNAKNVSNALSVSGIELKPIIFDPMLASYVVNPDNRHGLNEQAENLLGITLPSQEDLLGSGRKRLSTAEISIKSAAEYAGQRVAAILDLSRYYTDTLDDKQKSLLWEMELPLSAVLAKMEQTGLALDLPYLQHFSQELSTDLLKLEAEIYQLSGHNFNINSPQQLQKVLFEELKLSTQGKTKSKSGYSTDASVLEAIAGEHPIVSKILEYRQLSKLKSTYVDALPKQISPRDHRLHGEFNQTVTSTGRLSSSNPNLQNIPIRSELGRRIRRAFIPGNSNCLLMAADYSQIELRLLAHMSEDELLIDAFKQDQDIHARTAMEIFDTSLDKVTSDMRRVGKTLNFALVYQQGAYSTAQDLGISTKEAQGFIDKYFSRYPKVRRFLSSIIEKARVTGYAETLWGRKRYFRNLNDRNDVVRKAEERAACNAPLQGSAADLMKMAMIRLDKSLQTKGLSAKLILQVHDELVLEVPQSELEATASTVLEAMSQARNLLVPLKVDLGTGSNWMDCK